MFSISDETALFNRNRQSPCGTTADPRVDTLCDVHPIQQRRDGSKEMNQSIVDDGWGLDDERNELSLGRFKIYMNEFSSDCTYERVRGLVTGSPLYSTKFQSMHWSRVGARVVPVNRSTRAEQIAGDRVSKNIGDGRSNKDENAVRPDVVHHL
ncbi:hypothetical protein BD410DRAFT_536085 [Rickenella mellea]|uniref:Uncharacterized protein n=1 Tax=Rickenella mellea TaxID=50990 RepID=A0A4Y7PQQ1_9AGAM|nr:hypothetical protein BD410DRAFT_536085 [Rickenella mellea]